MPGEVEYWLNRAGWLHDCLIAAGDPISADRIRCAMLESYETGNTAISSIFRIIEKLQANWKRHLSEATRCEAERLLEEGKRWRESM